MGVDCGRSYEHRACDFVLSDISAYCKKRFFADKRRLGDLFKYVDIRFFLFAFLYQRRLVRVQPSAFLSARRFQALRRVDDKAWQSILHIEKKRILYPYRYYTSRIRCRYNGNLVARFSAGYNELRCNADY